MTVPNISFRPAWFATSPADMSSDDLGSYLVWLRYNMGAMPNDERMKAKAIQHALVAEQKRRRRTPKS